MIHRGGGYYQLLVQFPGCRDGSHRIGNGLAGTGAGLNHAHRGALARVIDSTQGIGNLGDHLPLAPARIE